ncbi:IclR family transcriptional regulator C-terminal domain-containing protein [Nocardia sp. NPDC050799]|uniref:IclR family transcriptional regulator domain-containing protein n=1 Tax=Nocardia sp. NPDC050799 TaxID=3154842 RepID=UPI0033C71AE2
MAESITGEVQAAPPSARDLVQSLQRGLAVIRVFGAGNPALTLDQVAARSGISRSATRRLLRTLMAAGHIRFDGHRFAPTARLLDLGYPQQSRLSLAEVARPHCESLAHRTGHTVSLARLEGPEAVYLVRVGLPRLMDVSIDVGTRLPAHLPAIGRVMLAWLPERELAEYLASDAYRDNPARTLQTQEELYEQLEQIRANGWCRSSGELDAGLSTLAVPVRDRSGNVVAGLNISTHTGEEELWDETGKIFHHLSECAAAIGSDVHPAHLS